MIRILILALVIGLAGCAQVPKESVELSATVGRDIQRAQESHLELARILFARMKDDINRFVDEEYAPFQTRFLFEQKAREAREPGATPSNSMLLLIDLAYSDEGTQEHRDVVITLMSKFTDSIRKDVESYRSELLAPIEAQEAEVVGSINRHYQQLHRANSIVTGHLSSVAKVHEVQNQLLEEFGLEADLREAAGTKLAETSNEVSELLQKAEDGSVKLDEVGDKLGELVKEIRERDQEE